VTSAIPAPFPDGRQIPFWLDIATLLLACCMLPACTLIPVPLLVAGRRCVRLTARAGSRWAAAWTGAASAGIAVETLFLVRFIGLIRAFGSGFPNLPEPSWNALDFSIAFMIAGGAMMVVLFGATRSSPTRPTPTS
jgi:hypothetical protein